MKSILSGDFDLTQIYAVLGEDSLTLEQRHRLLYVAQTKLRECCAVRWEFR